MKKFLVITSKSEKTVAWLERERYVRQFCEELKTYLSDYQVNYTTYQDIQISVIKGVVRVYDARNELDLATVDFVHFKNWTFEQEDAATIAHFLERRHIHSLNSEVNSGVATGKIAQMVRLAEAGLPVPDTFYARTDSLLKMLSGSTLPAGFNFPIILKANDGSKGDDNFLIKNFKEALDILKDPKQQSSAKEYVIQNFVPNDGDLRLLYIGLESEPLVFKRIPKGDSHLNNTSKDGSASFVDAKTLPPEIRKHAAKAAEILQREISGVDIIINKNTNQHYVLEVNATPALATGYGMNEKLKKFADFVSSVQEGYEEE